MAVLTQELNTAQRAECERNFRFDKEKILHERPGYRAAKRCHDIVFSFLALVFLFPWFILIGIIIVLDDPHAGPIFVQNRVGQNGKVFRFYKFRTMYADAEERKAALEKDNEMDGPVFKIRNDPRITRVGRFLRQSSIDEFLQFWNVLKGDMSLVGPRPPLCNEVEKYTEYEYQRLFVKPGLTCYWQIQPQRNSLSFAEWVELDLRYISERSIAVDWNIMWKTIGAIFGMHGI